MRSWNSERHDETTNYTYSTTKDTIGGDPRIPTGHLLQKMQYPDSLTAADVAPQFVPAT